MRTLEPRSLPLVAALVSVGFLAACNEPPVSPDSTADPQFAKWTCEERPDHPQCQDGGGDGGGGEEAPNWAIFADGYAVGGDGAGADDLDGDGAGDPNGYSDAESCVTVNWQIRTVSNSDACKASPDFRYLTFDLTDVPEADRVDLDQDGVVEDLEEAPARFTTSDGKGKFGCNQSKDEICVNIHVLQVFYDGSGNPTGTGQESVWTLDYTVGVAVGQNADGVPVITLDAGSAPAELCNEADRLSGNQGCPATAVWDMPFHVTWSNL